jgi:3-deoxy-manno-octulosonate cytidylyltransferase (CMP-KDO synthetase)
MFRIIIPARYASTRLQGKPLQLIGDKPMILHVYQRALEAGADSIIVATDHKGIQEVCEVEGAQVFYSDHEHQSGTERICEVVHHLNYADNDIIVNLQGDEPFVPASLLAQVSELLVQHSDINMASIYTDLKSQEDVFNSNIVKIALDKNNCALYFSRAPIPWLRGIFEQNLKDFDLSLFHHHLGIYGYRAKFLKEYHTLEPSPLETVEALEQLRVLWNGHKIILTKANEKPGVEVNTAEDLIKAQKYYDRVQKNF